MRASPAIVAVSASIIAVITGALAWPGTADTNRYVEPAAGQPIADGGYVGYVRTVGFTGATATVAVDFVAVRDGHMANTSPEVLVDAGALAHTDLLDRAARPFRVVVKDDVIVELQTADDELPATATSPR